MQKKIAFIIAIMLGSSVWAEDFNLYYAATSSDTNTKVESVKNLQKVVFENGNMVAILKDGTKKTVSLSLVQRLFFSTESGLVCVEEVKKTSTTDKHQVFDLMGRKLDEGIDIQKLPKGTYIIDGQKKLIR